MSSLGTSFGRLCSGTKFWKILIGDRLSIQIEALEICDVGKFHHPGASHVKIKVTIISLLRSLFGSFPKASMSEEKHCKIK